MTTGEQLKKKLHLLNFPYARIRRVLTGGSLRIYQIVFDSRTPLRPLTTYLLNNNILAPNVFDGNAEKYSYLPWADLEVFNAQLNPAIYLTTDVAGFYGKKNNYSEKVYQYKDKLEELTIPELRNVDMYTSQTTQKYKDQRKDFQGQGIKNTKLLDSVVIPETGSLRFIFLTESTEIDKKTLSHRMTKAKVDIKQQFDRASDKLVDNPSKTYDMYVQLDNVFPNSAFKDISWLETYNGEEVDEKMMKELLEVADVKLYDTTPAYQYQGFRYRLSQLGSSIYPETRPDNFWRSKHGSQGLLDKHFSQLLDSGTIQVFLNNMTSMLIKHCRKLGYAKNDSVTKKLVVSI